MAEWFAGVALADVELARERGGALVASRVLGRSLARVNLRELRGVCGALGLGRCLGLRKVELARLLAARKAEREGLGGGWRGVAYTGSKVTVAHKLAQLQREYPDVMAGTIGEDLLPHGAPTRLQTSAVAAAFDRPLRVTAFSPASKEVYASASSEVAPAVANESEAVEPAFETEDVDENYNVACFGNLTPPEDDIHFVTPLAQRTPPPKKVALPSPATSTLTAASAPTVIDADDPILDKWFKVSERISELRVKLSGEGDRDVVDELKDDIAFLVRKKRRLTQMR